MSFNAYEKKIITIVWGVTYRTARPLIYKPPFAGKGAMAAKITCVSICPDTARTPPARVAVGKFGPLFV